MPRTPKTVGPRRLRQKWRGEELWQVAGHNGQTNFVVNLIGRRGYGSERAQPDGVD